MSSHMLDRMAAHHGVQSAVTLTGTKWIPRPALDRPDAAVPLRLRGGAGVRRVQRDPGEGRGGGRTVDGRDRGRSRGRGTDDPGPPRRSGGHLRAALYRPSLDPARGSRSHRGPQRADAAVAFVAGLPPGRERGRPGSRPARRSRPTAQRRPALRSGRRVLGGGAPVGDRAQGQGLRRGGTCTSPSAASWMRPGRTALPASTPSSPRSKPSSEPDLGSILAPSGWQNRPQNQRSAGGSKAGTRTSWIRAVRSGNGANALLAAFERESLEVVPAVVERGDQPVQLLGGRGIGHQPVVGADRDPEPQPVQQVDRVFGQASGAAPECTLDVGQISSGIRRSRTYAASSPNTGSRSL